MAKLITKYSLLCFPIASAGLGYWQIKRLDWKKNLLTTLNKQIQEEPIDLLSINSAEDLNQLEYRRIKARGQYDPDPEHQLYLKPRQLVVNEEAFRRNRSAHQSNVGVNVITPFLIEGTDLRILVNRGWLATIGRDSVADSSHIGLEQGPVELVGIIRNSDNKPTYWMKNNLSSNEWQFRDIKAMAQALNTAPIYIEAEQDTKRTSGPYGGQTVLSVRNEHLNYAITWFGLAAFSFLMWYTKYGKIRLFKRSEIERR